MYGIEVHYTRYYWQAEAVKYGAIVLILVLALVS